MLTWKRPDNVPYPKTFIEFDGKVLVNGKKRKYWIQELTEEYYQTVIDGYVDDFLKNEPICSYNNVLSDKNAVDDFRKIWLELLSQKISLICLTKDDQGKTKVAGFNCVYVASKNDVDDVKCTSPLSQKVCDIVHYVTDQKDPFKELNIDKYLYAFGLSVLEEFRGEGLGQIIINARKQLCETFNIPASLTVFTSFISQKQAYRCGFKDLTVVDYNDLPEKLKTKNVSEHTTHCKCMYIMY